MTLWLLLKRYWRVLALLVTLMAGIAAGWLWRDYRATQDALTVSEAHIAEMKQKEVDYLAASAIRDAKLKTLGEENTRLQKTLPKIITKTRTEYVKDSYTRCVMPSDGLSILREAERATLP